MSDFDPKAVIEIVVGAALIGIVAAVGVTWFTGYYKCVAECDSKTDAHAICIRICR